MEHIALILVSFFALAALILMLLRSFLRDLSDFLLAVVDEVAVWIERYKSWKSPHENDAPEDQLLPEPRHEAGARAPEEGR